MSSLPSSISTDKPFSKSGYTLKVVIIIFVTISVLGLLVYGLYAGFREKDYNYRYDIPDSVIKSVESYFAKDKYPNMTSEDIKKIINSRYKVLPNCNEKSTDIAKDCNLSDLYWSCGDADRVWGSNCDNMDKTIVQRSDASITKLLDDISAPYAQEGDDKISCSHIIPNKVNPDKKVVDKDTRGKIQNVLNTCSWNKNPDGSLIKDFTKL